MRDNQMKKRQISTEEFDARIVVNTRSESEPIMVFAEYLPTGEIIVRLAAKEGERVRALNEIAEVLKALAKQVKD